MNSKFVTHPGFIKSISGNKAEVAIIAKSGCASCEINGSCSVSDTSEKMIDVKLPDGEDEYRIGQAVTIKMKQSNGTWAIMFGYVFPFVVIVATLVFLTALNLDQGLAGILSLSMLIPYYFALYLSRNVFKKSFNHSIV
jgi:sigma-E factor negative regulatory protein RseC